MRARREGSIDIASGNHGPFEQVLVLGVDARCAGREGISIPARSLPKIKTMVQDFAIAFCVLPITAQLKWLQIATLWCAVALTIYTGWQYYADGKRASTT